jgi:phosphatidylglycerol:prolipoprotein diacylglycerol transferase
MIPELFKIGPLTINSFGVMAMFAFLVPTLLLRKEMRRIKFDPELANGIAIAAMIGGFVGARLYYIIERWDRFLADPMDYIFTGAGLVWYGGLLGGFLAVAWYIRRKSIAVALVSDLMAPLLALGQTFGRVGCLLSGDGDYGPPSDLPWAMSFPKGIIPTTDKVHPTPIYDMVLLFAIFIVLWQLRRKALPNGFKISLYLALLGIERFTTEFFRTTPEVLAGLTVAQIISIILLAAGCLGMILAGRDKEVKPPATAKSS